MTEDRLDDPAEDLRSVIESAIDKQEMLPVEESVKSEPESRERDEKGRFVSKAEAGTESIEPKPSEPESEPQKPAPEAKDATVDAEVAKPPSRPPPGFSVASKAAWEGLPQYIRDDIVKREQEVDTGFKRYAGLGRFAEEAERNGTTLQQAVHDYASVENALRQDFLGGIEFICRRMGIDPRSVAQVMANKYTTQQQREEDRQSTAIDPNAITEHALNQMRRELEYRDSNSKIVAFAADPKNKYFDNLRQDMAQIINAGKADTLEQAYEAACWLNPDIRSILINEANATKTKEAAAAVSKSRSAAKAVGGSPVAGINPDATKRRRDLSLEEEINAAIDAQTNAA